MLKAIYFDYHGVLDRRNFVGLQQAIAKASGQPDTDKIASQVASIGLPYDTGQVSPHAFWNLVERRYGSSASRAGREYILHVEPVLDMWNLASDLHANYDLGLFTDCPGDKKEVIRSAYALTDYFDYLLFSCDVQSSKQDPAFYQLMRQGEKYQPEECLLVDDSEQNCTLAINQGFQAHLFQDAPTLKNYLHMS